MYIYIVNELVHMDISLAVCLSYTCNRVHLHIVFVLLYSV